MHDPDNAKINEYMAKAESLLNRAGTNSQYQMPAEDRQARTNVGLAWLAMARFQHERGQSADAGAIEARVSNIERDLIPSSGGSFVSEVMERFPDVLRAVGMTPEADDG